MKRLFNKKENIVARIAPVTREYSFSYVKSPVTREYSFSYVK